MCTGQVLFKKTAIILAEIDIKFSFINLVDYFLNLIRIHYFCIAIIVYASATLFWLYILQRIPLSLAYPFTALAMVIIPIVSTFMFNEKLNINYWFGAGLIVSGILVISLES